MASYLKLRITNLGTAENPFFGIKFGTWSEADGFSNFTYHQFYFVEERQNAFEAEIKPELTESIKEAFELDLVPSGDWEVQYDGYYVYLYSTIDGVVFYPSQTSQGMVYTASYENVDTSVIDLNQTLPANALLNAYNDNVIKFVAPEKPKLEVTVNDQLPITLYPDPDGQYHYNLKDQATTLINQNKFKDEVLPDIEQNGYTYLDTSLFLEMEINFFDVFFSQKATVYFLKSVQQIKNYREKFVDRNYFLSGKKITYYEGYPFDFTLFAKHAMAVFIKNKTTGLSCELDVEKTTNRIFLSQGSRNLTIDEILPLQTGINRLEWEFIEYDGANDFQELIINKKESKCAPYFKFYRNDGGFGYIRFEPEIKIDNKTKDGESINVDYDGIQNTLSRIITDKSTTVEMELQTEPLESWEMENFKDFLSSPRVEMYVSDLYQKQEVNSWVGVRVSSSSMSTKKTKTKLNRERVIIEIDNYNLHL